MILKTFLLIYLLCGFTICAYIKQLIDSVGGFDGVYNAAKIINPDIADKIKEYDFDNSKIKFAFNAVIVLLWPMFIPNLFNRY